MHCKPPHLFYLYRCVSVLEFGVGQTAASVVVGVCPRTRLFDRPADSSMKSRHNSPRPAWRPSLEHLRAVCALSRIPASMWGSLRPSFWFRRSRTRPSVPTACCLGSRFLLHEPHEYCADYLFRCTLAGGGDSFRLGVFQAAHDGHRGARPRTRGGQVRYSAVDSSATLCGRCSVRRCGAPVTVLSRPIPSRCPQRRWHSAAGRFLAARVSFGCCSCPHFAHQRRTNVIIAAHLSFGGESPPG